MGRGCAVSKDQSGEAEPLTALPWLSYISGGGKGLCSGCGRCTHGHIRIVKGPDYTEKLYEEEDDIKL